MKILHILRGLEQSSGISAFLVENANRQAACGHDVGLLYERYFEYRPSQRVKVFKGKTPFGIEFAPDIVHIHAVWSFFSIFAMLWCVLRRIPFVISPHGCLMPSVFGKKKWLKKMFYSLLVRPLMRKATAIHVTARPEAEAIRKLGFRQNIEIIPLGVDLPPHKTSDSEKAMRTMLFMGRISPEKGLVNLLQAWRQIDFTGWKLMLAGPDWKGYKVVIDNEITRLGLASNVLFPGIVVGDVKDEMYNSADCFVLPSPMENFSAVVLEALAHGLPVIATKGTPWNELEEYDCGWWIDQGVAPLANVLRQVLRMTDEELTKMGDRGMQLVRKKYLWEAVANATMGLYEKIINNNEHNPA
jgi:glycosyltransferase involved in cell wall biosynthesis